MSYPDEFLQSVPKSIIEAITENKKYEHYRYEDELEPKIQRETTLKKKELERVKLDLSILKEQEGDVNTVEEERLVRYWKEEREREMVKHRNKIQAVEEQLARMRQNALETETYYNSRVTTAEENLERKKNARSKPRIKYEMKIAELEKFFDQKEKAFKGHTAYKTAVEQFQKLYEKYKTERHRQFTYSATADPVPIHGSKRQPKKAKQVVEYHQPLEQEQEQEPSSVASDA